MEHVVDEKQQLYRLLAAVRTPEEIAMLLEDLCTYKEVDYMAQRVECAKLFLEGCTYQQIVEKADISTATLGRINKCIQRGSGGYSTVLKGFLEAENEQNGR